MATGSDEMSDAPARKVKIPADYESEEAFIKEARERFQQGVDFDKENREQGVSDLKFLAGEQWEKEDLASRKGRPCLTINQLPQFVAQVVGDLRINKPAIKVRPVEDADKDLAEVREGLIRSIEQQCDAQGVYVSAGEAQVSCGIGNFRVGLAYANDDGFEVDIKLESIPDPFAVVWDPFSVERTGRDAQWAFVSDDMPRKAFEERWKDELPSDLVIPQSDTDGWYTTDTVRVTEYWRIKSTPQKVALLETGEVVPLDRVPQGAKPKRTRTVMRKSAEMYLISGKAVLEGPIEWPIDRVPVIRAQGWVVTVGSKRIRWGLVRAAKDSQRLKNYWRSVSAEMLALAPKAKWLLHESQEGEQESFREAHASDDSVLTWSGAVKPEFIAPPSINSAVLQEAALNAQDMKDVTGLHDASLGAQSNETSGKAIMARERQGDVATYIYSDNLHAAIREGGRVVNDLIPLSYDTARTVRTIGADEESKVLRINDPNDPESVDINRGKYDVAIETGPSYSTKRVEAAESMTEFVRAFPAAAPFIGDLIAKAQDWPMADKIAERLMKMLPPQLQADEQGNQPPPPPPSPQEQQAMQMQQAAAELEMKGKQAEVAKAEAEVEIALANAAKAKADAMKAEFEAGAMIGAAPQESAENFGQGSPAPEQSAMGEALPAA